MRQYLTPHDVANQIRMRRSQWAGAFLLVEGGTDARFYGRFVHYESIVVADGKEQVIQCLRLLVGHAFPGVAAIVDRDEWALGEGAMPEIPGLMCTDDRDLEIMALRSPALGRVLDTYGSEDKLAGLQAGGTSAVDILLGAGSELGYLRWLCVRDQSRGDRDPATALAPDGPLRLKFKKLSFGKFLDRRTLEVDRKRLVRAISDHSRQPLHVQRVEEALDGLRQLASETSVDPWDLCAGHDLVKILEIGLCSRFGSCQQVTLEKLDGVLLLAYQDAHFERTLLFAAMQAWSTAHPEHTLFSLP